MEKSLCKQGKFKIKKRLKKKLDKIRVIKLNKMSNLIGTDNTLKVKISMNFACIKFEEKQIKEKFYNKKIYILSLL